MEQISYEIILLLLKRPAHARQLAKDLNTNHMTVNRKLKELQLQNILDHEQQGKNKVYHIKDTIEAKQTINMAEHYKQIKTIKKYPELRNIFKKIKANKKISLALLFGSYAKHTSKKGSDIDIFIQTKDRNIKKQLSMINSRLSIKIGNYNKDNLLVKEIKDNHVIIKGVEEYYEKISY